MTRDLSQMWLRFLGGKKERAGFGIAAIGLVLGILGVCVAFLAPEPRDNHALFWVGFTAAILGIIVGIAGSIVHFSTLSDAQK